MKQVNFRIIELKEHQVLFMKDFAEDMDSGYLIAIVFFFEEVKIKSILEYKTQQGRDLEFDMINEEMAKMAVDNLIKKLKNP